MIPYFYFPTFHIGPIPINIWGFFVSLGFGIAIWIAYKRIKSLGLDPNKILDLSFWIIIASMIGARLGHVFFYEWGYFSQHLLEIVRIDQGGLSSFGGFVGAVIAFWVYNKTTPVPSLKRRGDCSNPLGGGARGGAWFIWHYVDAIMFAFPLGWAIGRIGCFLIHDHPGAFTNFILGVKYPDGIRHDLGLYESLFLFFYFFIFLLISHKRHFAPGFCVACLMVFYGIMRFFLDFLRVYDTRYFGLTPAQYGSIALVVLGAYLWYNSGKNIKIDQH